MKAFWMRGVALSVLLAMGGLSGRAVAQQGAGTIGGQVLNEAGQPVAGARVVVTNRATKATRGVLTREDGAFRISQLLPGSYAVGVRAIGYRTLERQERSLGAEEEVVISVILVAAPVQLDPLQVVSVTRSSVPLAAIPGAITVITREEIEAQAQVTPRMGQVLTQLVPGLGAGTETVSNYGQNLRGRTVSVLIDGVPQSTSRNVTRDFANIDPVMVERVEVIRGATSIYGDGGTGGVINIITRRGGAGQVRLSTDVGVETSLSNVGAGTGPRVAQTVSGGRGAWEVLASGSFTRTAALFDAQGDRIPPDPTGQGGFAETDSYDLLGKVGYSFGAQRLQLSANYFRSEQSTAFTSDVGVNDLPAYEQKSRTIPGLELARGQGSENALLNLEYTHPTLWGSRVRAQAYYREYATTFRPADFRRFESLGNLIFQSYVDSRKQGGRFEVESPLKRALGATLLWGVDYTDESTSQPVYIFDPDAYDQSGGLVFRQTGSGVFVPPIDQRNLGAFAQLAVNPWKRLLVRGGVRHERAAMEVADFTSLGGVAVSGGELRFRPTLFNLGATLTAGNAVSIFANFSQGFSLSDLGRVIREPRPGFTLGSKEADAQRVDQYEVGVRGSWLPVQASLTAFRNESDLGTSLGPNLEVLRAPERVRGVEATLDVQPVSRFGLGGTASWAEGEYLQGDTLWRPLNSFRIQPLKLTGYVEHQVLPRWKNRLQVLYSGVRGRAFSEAVERGANPLNPGFGLRPVESYTIVDLLSQLRVGPGTLNLGVRNLLNKQYFPVVSQLMPIGNTSYSAAPGAVLSIGYSVRY